MKKIKESTGARNLPTEGAGGAEERVRRERATAKARANIVAAVEAYDAAEPGKAMGNISDHIAQDSAELVKAIGLLSCALASIDGDEEITGTVPFLAGELASAVAILAEVRESLRWCIRVPLESSGVIASSSLESALERS